ELRMWARNGLRKIPPRQFHHPDAGHRHDKDFGKYLLHTRDQRRGGGRTRWRDGETHRPYFRGEGAPAQGGRCENMMTFEQFLIGTGTVLLLLMLSALYRIAVGLTTLDRIVAANVIGTKT